MNLDILFSLLLQLGIMAGFLAFVTFFLMIQFKLKAQGKWDVELNDNGMLENHLVAESSQNRVTADDGEYIIPETPRMYSVWPRGLPRFMQVEVRHEKYIKGEETPIVLPTVIEFTNTAVNTNRLVNMNLIKAFGDMLDDTSSLETILKKWFPLVAIGMIVLAGAAGAAAFFSYQVNQELEVLQATMNRALGNL